MLIAAFDSRLTVTTYTIATEKLTSPVRLVLLTDLHSSRFGEKQSELIAAIDAQSPDALLLAGDIADDVTPHADAIQLIDGIAGRYPAYYVSGNHELWGGAGEYIKNYFESSGIEVLEGERHAITLAGQAFNICGVDDPAIDVDIFEKQLDDAFAGIDESKYTILLSHRPEWFEEQSLYPCDLVLAGHTHGGQWRVPFIINGIYAPNQGFWPRYPGGLFALNGVQMIVSRGLSPDSIWIPRIFNPPELVVIDLIPKELENVY